jgi:hypothetical protein
MPPPAALTAEEVAGASLGEEPIIVAMPVTGEVLLVESFAMYHADKAVTPPTVNLSTGGKEVLESSRRVVASTHESSGGS